jgi:CBS-domain-containing membrane protein
VTQREAILDAAQLMHNRNFRHLPVVSPSSKITGIISAQDIVDSLNFALQSHSSSDQIKDSLAIPVEKIMSPSIIAAEPGDGLSEIIKKIVHYNIGALPVVNELGTIQGIITLRDLVALMGMSSNALNVPVSEVMNRNVIKISVDDTFRRAVQLMSQRRIRRLPILSRKGKMIGLVTNKDILRYLLETTLEKEDAKRARNDHEFSIPVLDLMTKDVITVNQDDDLRVAASRMMIFGVGGLIIEGVPEGDISLITERDLIRTLSMRKSVDFIVEAIRYETEEAR